MGEIALASNFDMSRLDMSKWQANMHHAHARKSLWEPDLRTWAVGILACYLDMSNLDMSKLDASAISLYDFTLVFIVTLQQYNLALEWEF